MHDRFRTTLASAALVASLSVAGVANANGGGEEHGGKGHGKPTKACKEKHGKGYLVHGLFVGGDLTQVAGGDTERWGDDRWSGTVEVEVLKGNRRGRRDVGLSSYGVTNVRVVGAKDGVLPEEGTRLQLIGKQTNSCAPAPTTPTTPEPTTPAETTPEPTATLAEYEADDDAAETTSGVPDVDTESRDPKGREDRPGKGKPTPERPSSTDDAEDDGDRERGDDRGRDDDAPTEAADDSEVATPVTDVTIRVIHFKVRPAAARR